VLIEFSKSLIANKDCAMILAAITDVDLRNLPCFRPFQQFLLGKNSDSALRQSVNLSNIIRLHCDTQTLINQMDNTKLTCREIFQLMKEVAPPSPVEPQDPAVLNRLQELTQTLIQAYQESGRLQGDPFNDAWVRPLSLYEADVRQAIQGNVVMVTGGEGYVGRDLVQALVNLGAGRVVSVDHVRCGGASTPLQKAIPGSAPNVALYAADVRDYETLDQIFALEQPAIVFHLAALRIPGLAEKQILTTVTSNIFGTQNIIKLCEAHRVQHCVFSSTGKASRYWTAEVYAASKKMAEWMFAEAAQTGKVCYSMVRFTHMLNNSSMVEQIDAKVAAGKPVNIHTPDRYVVGQNVGEAVHLLLNALLIAEPKRLRFVLVRNLGWPTESLEVALYKIMESGKNLPIYFQGLPVGYEEPFFLGQVDWDNQMEINTLVNALETEYNFEISSTNDMILSEVIPFSVPLLHQNLERLRPMCDDSTLNPAELKKQLGEAIREISLSSFLLMAPERSLQILRWGINVKQYQRGEMHLPSYQPFIELVVRSLNNRLTVQMLDNFGFSAPEFETVLSILDTIPTLATEVSAMRQLNNSRFELRQVA
jgi:nucleoside-diphosphate-sugar epimerase